MATPFSTDELSAIRTALPAVGAGAYLNAGTLGPLPAVAVEAMRAEHRYDVERRQCERLWERLGELQVAARTALTQLVGVDVGQMALMHSTHEGVNTALWGLPLEAGDNVVTTGEEHPGVYVPLRQVRDRRGAEIRIAPWGADDASFVDELLRVVDGRTRAVVVSHVSWVSGRIAPLRALRDALPAGCRLIVDGAQSAGVLATDPTRDGWDAYTISGQKWPCGPNGSGGTAFVDPTAWLPTFGAFMQVTDYADCLGSPLVTDGRRFETSQEAMTPLAGLAASIDWLLRQVGVDRAAAHAAHLNERARRRLAPLLADAGLDPAAAMLGHAHLLCVEVPADRAVPIVAGLCARDVVIRSLSPSRVRISFGSWTTTDEVDACMDGIGELLLERP